MGSGKINYSDEGHTFKRGVRGKAGYIQQDAVNSAKRIQRDA